MEKFNFSRSCVEPCGFLKAFKKLLKLHLYCAQLLLHFLLNNEKMQRIMNYILSNMLSSFNRIGKGCNDFESLSFSKAFIVKFSDLPEGQFPA